MRQDTGTIRRRGTSRSRRSSRNRRRRRTRASNELRHRRTSLKCRRARGLVRPANSTSAAQLAAACALLRWSLPRGGEEMRSGSNKNGTGMCGAEQGGSQAGRGDRRGGAWRACPRCGGAGASRGGGVGGTAPMQGCGRRALGGNGGAAVRLVCMGCSGLASTSGQQVERWPPWGSSREQVTEIFWRRRAVW